MEAQASELREEIFAQVACHISVTFTSQNNSRLSLAPTSASSLCLSHALCVDSEGNLLQNIVDKASWAEIVCERVYVVDRGEREQYFLCLEGLFIWKWQGRPTVNLCDTLDLAKVEEHPPFIDKSCFCSKTMRQMKQKNISLSIFNPVQLYNSYLFHTVVNYDEC